MSHLDVYRLKAGQLVVDIQADLLSYLNTRVVVALVKSDAAPTSLRRLHPIFAVDGVMYTFAPHLTATVPVRELGEVVGTLRDHRNEIIRAFDVLLTGA
jgi:toxin CcdB